MGLARPEMGAHVAPWRTTGVARGRQEAQGEAMGAPEAEREARAEPAEEKAEMGELVGGMAGREGPAVEMAGWEGQAEAREAREALGAWARAAQVPDSEETRPPHA